MPAPRKDRKLRGSYQRTREPPSLAYSAPPSGELSAEQRTLLKLRPGRLTLSEKFEYRRKVIDAPWLQAGDAELVALWCQARSRYLTTSKAFDRLLRDPEFAVAGSDVAKAAIATGRVVHRESTAMINLAHRLGLSPAGRLALGVTGRRSAEKDDKDDVWKALRLVRKDGEGAA
jgi:phage terminase small subunit